VTRLSTELRRSLDFYLARLRGQAIAKVVLTGGTAKLGNLAPFLVAALGLSVEIGDPFAMCDVGAGFPPGYLEDVAPMMAVAVGLALRGAHA
jgi:type IV pilus assembly protein PilM